MVELGTWGIFAFLNFLAFSKPNQKETKLFKPSTTWLKGHTPIWM